MPPTLITEGRRRLGHARSEDRASPARVAERKRAMSNGERLVLAVFLALPMLLSSGADGSADGEASAMARAVLPPPLPAAPSGTDWRQPQRGAPREAPRREPMKNGHSAASHPRAAFSPKPVAALDHGNHERRHRDRASLTGRGERRHNRHPVGGISREEAYADPDVASAATAPVAPPPPPFGYYPEPLPAYGYAPVYQPPWLPGPALQMKR